MRILKKLAVLCLGAAMLLTGCGSREDDPLAVPEIEHPSVAVGQVAYDMEDFNAMFLFFKTDLDAALEQQGMSPELLLDQEGGRELYNSQIASHAVQHLATSGALWNMMLEEGLTLDQEQLDQLMAENQELLGGQEGLDQTLENMNMDRERFTRLVLTPETMIRQLRPHFFEKDPAAIRANYEENFLRCKHVLIGDDSPEGDPEKQALAQEIADRAKAGEDFDALVAEYGEDPGMAANPDGYIFPEGQMVQEFYEGTKALELNAVSDPIRSDFGWHVILRLPIDDEAYAANEEAAKEAYFTAQVNEWLEEDKVTISDEAMAVDFETLTGPAPETAEETAPEAGTQE